VTLVCRNISAPILATRAGDDTLTSAHSIATRP
jgi:hypothetical protein